MSEDRPEYSTPGGGGPSLAWYSEVPHVRMSAIGPVEVRGETDVVVDVRRLKAHIDALEARIAALEAKNA